MNLTSRFFNQVSFVVAGVVWILSFLLFYYDTGEFWKCIAAATLTAGLVWATYMVLRWLVLAYKS